MLVTLGSERVNGIFKPHSECSTFLHILLHVSLKGTGLYL